MGRGWPVERRLCLGATLYMLLTGRRPFEGEHGRGADRVRRGQFPPLAG